MNTPATENLRTFDAELFGPQGLDGPDLRTLSAGSFHVVPVSWGDRFTGHPWFYSSSMVLNPSWRYGCNILRMAAWKYGLPSHDAASTINRHPLLTLDILAELRHDGWKTLYLRHSNTIVKYLHKLWTLVIVSRDLVIHMDQDLIHKGPFYLLTDTLPLF